MTVYGYGYGCVVLIWDPVNLRFARKRFTYFTLAYLPRNEVLLQSSLSFSSLTVPVGGT